MPGSFASIGTAWGSFGHDHNIDGGAMAERTYDGGESAVLLAREPVE